MNHTIHLSSLINEIARKQLAIYKRIDFMKELNVRVFVDIDGHSIVQYWIVYARRQEEPTVVEFGNDLPLAVMAYNEVQPG